MWSNKDCKNWRWGSWLTWKSKNAEKIPLLHWNYHCHFHNNLLIN